MGNGQGSGGNVIAAICSLLLPGLGQLVQGRVTLAVIYFVVGTVVWWMTLSWFGWVVNVIACISAARFKA